MVCNRCIAAVKSELDKLGAEYIDVLLGEVRLKKELQENKRISLVDNLEKLGFSIIDNKRERTIEKIKTLIIELIYNNNNNIKTNLSEYISDKLNHDYNYISNLFSEMEGITIEKYFIAQKIERVKELLVYDELSLSEISFQLNYSSVAHLSSQFKKVTGFTPSDYKKTNINKRKPLDMV